MNKAMNKSGSSSVRQSLQANPRLMWGIILIVVLAAIFTHSKMQSWKSEIRAQLDAVDRNIAITSQADAFETWKTRAEESLSARSAWEKRIWTGPTPGIISAGAQSTLGAMAGSAGLESVQVTVASDPVLVDSRNLLRFEIVAIAKAQSFLTCLVELSTHDQSILIAELDADISGKQSSRIRIAGYLPIQITAADAGDAQ